jgi:hypothetical protein
MNAVAGVRSPVAGIDQLQVDKNSPGSMSEEFLISSEQSAQRPAPQPERLALLSRSSVLLSGILDSFSSFFFYLSFSSLTHLLSSWCSRFLAEE